MLPPAKLGRVGWLIPVVLSLPLVGCATELPTEAEQDDRTLLIWGYVMSRGNPARGVAGLVDPAGTLLVTTRVETGRYLIGLTLAPGTRVCDGYRLRVAIEVGRGSELEERLLQPSSGDCVIPPQDVARHTLDFAFPSGDDPGAGGAA